MRLLPAVLILSLALRPRARIARRGLPDNPCRVKDAPELLCPNLRIGPPREIYVQNVGPGASCCGRPATSAAAAAGRSSCTARRNGRRTMKVTQRIYNVGGGHITVRTEASLHFTDVGSYFGGSYWKVHQLPASSCAGLGPDGKVGGVVRTSPKLNYCLRDLYRTRAGAHSPPNRVYPGCNQNPYRDRVKLGTSVGWSDIYPAAYDQQWINVAGLRGCFAYRMIVDPKHHLFESNENDNTSRRLVHLPFRGRPGC